MFSRNFSISCVGSRYLYVNRSKGKHNFFLTFNCGSYVTNCELLFSLLHGGYACLVTVDNKMEEKVSLEEMNRRWDILLNTRKRQSDELVRPMAIPPSSSMADPFDCSDCAVPPTFALVEDAVGQAVNEWHDLDDRKILEEELDESVQKKPKWYNMHVRLPTGFDVTTKDDEPPADDGGGDRVVKLDDPTVTSSYHQELWHLFKAVPTRSMLERNALEGLSSPAMIALRNAWRQKEANNSLLDHFQICNLRANERHGAPETAFSPPSQKTKGTIVFEIWKGMTKTLVNYQLTSSPSDERLVLEFRGDQTLVDFHRALVELYGDDFWENGVQNNVEKTTGGEKNCSGMFIIEEKIYIHGDVDYSIPIMEWLAPWKDRAQRDLGIELADLSVQPMTSVRLEQIAMRLGVRYLHVHNGSIKCQVFLIDRRYGYPRQPTIARNYPIIHDMWSCGWSAQDCEACCHRIGTVVTAPVCDLTDGSKLLCQDCADLLQIPAKERQAHNVWKVSGTLGSGRR